MSKLELKIDPEFRDKIPKLTDEEFQKLEENILADGEVRDPIVVWNGTIIDGHNRWKIIQKHPEIPYKIKEMKFTDKFAAVVWMCHNQLGRRNVTDEQKTVLIGEAYKAQKMISGGDRRSKSFSSHHCDDLKIKPQKTKEKIAKRFGVGAATVERAEHFVDGLNAADEIAPGFKSATLSGEVKAPKSTIAEIRFVKTYYGEYKKADLIKRLAKRSPGDIIRAGKASVAGGNKKYAREILAIYNMGTTVNRLDDRL